MDAPRHHLPAPHQRAARSLLGAAVILSAAFATRSAAAGTPISDGVWHQLSWPTARYGATVVHDSTRDRFVLFGGYDGARENDTWILTPGPTITWQPLVTTGTPPSGRYTHSAVFDPVGDRMIVFGGQGDSLLADAWQLSFAGTPTWTPLVPGGPAPSARYRHTAVYDDLARRMIVFGGRDSVGLRADVWSLDLAGGTGWSDVTPDVAGPSARYRHTAIFDRAHDRMVVFAGNDGTDRNDTWALDLAGTPSWSPLAPSGAPPSPRNSHNAVYDAAAERMLVFGGPDSLENDVWSLALDAPQWGSVTTAGTPPVAHVSCAAAYDPARDRMIVFGGEVDDSTQSAELSLLSFAGGAGWSHVPVAGLAPGRYMHSAVYDSRDHSMIVYGGFFTSPDSSFIRTDQPWRLALGDTPYWSPMVPVGTPPGARFMHAAIYDPVRDRMIVYGGFKSNGPTIHLDVFYRDTWALSLSGTPQWSQVDTHGPGPLSSSCRYLGVYDSRRDRAIVLVADYGLPVRAWSLQLGDSAATWTEILASAQPLEHLNASAIYDPVRDRVLVFGGYLSASVQETNDVYALSLGGSPHWDLLAPSGVPPTPRERTTTYYDSVRDAMILFGGWGPLTATCFGDAWELSLSGTPAWRMMSPAPPAPAAPGGREFATTLYDPVHDRAVVYGGSPCETRPSYDDTWFLDRTTPVRPGLECAGDLSASTGAPLALEYPVMNPLGGARAVEWRLDASRAWPGLPPHGVIDLAAFATDTVRIAAPVPDTATAGTVLTFSASFAGGAGWDTTCARTVSVLVDVLASLVSATAEPGHVRIAWSTRARGPVIVYRAERAGAWRAVATLDAERDAIAYEDDAVTPGERYGYRLGWNEARGPVTAGEVWLDVPAEYRFALEGLRPNPAFRGAAAIGFTLPRAGRATLAVYDVAGRRVGGIRTLELAAGPHRTGLGQWTGLAPGVYTLELTFGGQRLRRRAVFLD